MLVQRSLQPPPLPALRVVGGHVALALARHFEPRAFEGGDDLGAALHDAVLDALHQVVPDQLAGVGLVLETGPQVRRLDVGAMAGLLRPRPRRVVRPAPAVLVVEGVAQRVQGLLPAGRCDVQALARLQVAPGGQDVHVDAAAVLAVQDRRPRVAVRHQSRPRRLLELVEHGIDLRVGRPVFRRLRDHDRAVLVLELQRVGDGGHHVRIAPEHLVHQHVARGAVGPELSDGQRRFTRLTNSHSKKVANHACQVALWVVYYNWCRQHRTTVLEPAQAVRLTDELRDMDWLLWPVEARDKQPGPRGPYRRERKSRRTRGSGGNAGMVIKSSV